jgi:hypothetical protein
MNVYVDQPWRNHEPGDVDHSIHGFGIEYSNSGNNAVLDADVGYLVNGTRRVDHAPATEKQRSAHRHLRTEKNRFVVQLGPGDGAAAEHLVMNCATKSLEIGIPKSIGICRTHRQKIPQYRDTSLASVLQLTLRLALAQCWWKAIAWLGQRGTGAHGGHDPWG